MDPSQGDNQLFRFTDRSWNELIDRWNALDLIDGQNWSNAHERRNDVRHKYRHIIRCRILRSNGTSILHTAKARDISPWGIRFFLISYLNPFSRCTVMLNRNRGKFRNVPARIVWCRRIEPFTHEAGAQFDSSLRVQNLY